MRCLKCGYISFDKVQTCSKCAASLAEVSESISGTVLKVETPFFLASVMSEDKEDFGGEEFDLSEAVDDEAVDVDVAEEDVDAYLDEGEEVEIDEDESDVPSIDLSQFEEGQDESLEEEDGDVEVELDMGDEDEGDEDHSIDFQLEDEDTSGLEVEAEEPEEPEESPEVAGSIDFELDSEEESDSTEIEPDAESELDAIEVGELELGEEFEPEPSFESSGETKEVEAEGGISLDLDVELEDEPLEDEMVFNLEDIDMSDLVIEEGDDSAPSGDEVALDLENFLEDGGEAGEEELEDVPMDLNLEDGELVPGERNLSQDDNDQDLPEIEL